MGLLSGFAQGFQAGPGGARSTKTIEDETGIMKLKKQKSRAVLTSSFLTILANPATDDETFVDTWAQLEELRTGVAVTKQERLQIDPNALRVGAKEFKIADVILSEALASGRPIDDATMNKVRMTLAQSTKKLGGTEDPVLKAKAAQFFEANEAQDQKDIDVFTEFSRKQQSRSVTRQDLQGFMASKNNQRTISKRRANFIIDETNANLQADRKELSGSTRDEFIAGTEGPTRDALDRANISKGRVAAAGATQVNLGTSTKAQLEKDIISADSNIEGFNNIEASFRPEFLTIGGKVKAGTQRFVDKVGAGDALGTEFLQQRATWFSQAMSAFIAYRKWATGVAGGEKEMKQIAKAFPDPERNSPAEYIANLKQSRITARKLKTRLLMFRVAGIENPTEEQFASIPLDSIPDVSEEQNIDLSDEDAALQKKIDEANRNR